MPNYDYTCTKCDHKLEAFQKMSEAPLTLCPNCKNESLQRRPGGGIGLAFKGSGFYITDYNTPSSPSSKPDCCPCNKKGCEN